MYKFQICYKYECVNILFLSICIYKNFNYGISIFNSNLIFHLQKYSMGFFLGGGEMCVGNVRFWNADDAVGCRMLFS